MKTVRTHLMRVLLALTLALSLCLSLMVPSFAASSTASLFAGGSGTKEDPYQIETVAQMLAINTDLGGNYELAADIDFSDVKAWVPIGYISIGEELIESEQIPAALAFHGTFNGNGHTLKNLTLPADIIGAGVFGFTAGNARISNVNIENMNITSALCGGGLIGWASGNTVLSDITATNCTAKALSMAGAVCGSSNGNVVCKNITVKGGSAITGVQLADGKINLLASYGQAGGIIGGADGTSFAGCSVSDFTVKSVSTKTDGFGGIAGCANEARYIMNCSVENVTITAKTCHSVGGLVGFTGSEAGIKDAAKGTKVTGCSVKNVKIKTGKNAERIGGLIGGGTYRSNEQSQPFAFLIRNCSVTDVTLNTKGKYVGAVLGYLPKSSSVNACSVKNVKLNSKALTKPVGATWKTVPTSELIQYSLM